MIEVTDLKFSYNEKPFLENISFTVGKGEILGFLGPSGAGKSTLQKILTGLIGNYTGNALVSGMQCKKHNHQFYERIGVDFEFSTLYEKFTAKQNLQYFGSLYAGPLRCIHELLEMVGLENDGDKRVSDYSKGMKSRLNFVKALLHDPEILFLDEPTSGLDPTNSRLMKDSILEEKRKGKTIILTTHNMYDATELCDKVAFIVGGKIMAMDSPHNLIMSKGATKLRYSYGDTGEKHGECLLSDMVKDTTLNAVIQNHKLLSIHSSEPTLNDIFMEITGRSLQ